MLVARSLDQDLDDYPETAHLRHIVLSNRYYHGTFYLILAASEFFLVLMAIRYENKYELAMAAVVAMCMGVLPLIEDSLQPPDGEWVRHLA